MSFICSGDNKLSVGTELHFKYKTLVVGKDHRRLRKILDIRGIENPYPLIIACGSHLVENRIELNIVNLCRVSP